MKTVVRNPHYLPLWAAMFIALFLTVLNSLQSPAQTATSHFVADRQAVQAAEIRTAGIAEDIRSVTGFDVNAFIEAALNPAASQVKPQAVAATAEARDVKTQKVVQISGGTGWGQPGPNYVKDGTTYVIAPYDASIIQGAPAKLGPKSFSNSVQQGTNQMVANAAALPRSHCEFEGMSQAQVVAQNAAAQVSRDVCGTVHVTGQGTPGNTGNGFVTALPAHLGPIQLGNAIPLGPHATADYYNLTGDLWGNTPDFRNPLSVVAGVISLLEPGPDGNHYRPNAYTTEFREDLVYKTNERGEIDPNGNVTQHVQFSENGLVIAAEKLGIPMNEQTKQMLRDAAPQGLPGVRSMPVTPRELVENPSPENIVKFFTGKVDSTGRVVESGTPGLPDPAVMLEDAVDGLLQHPVGEAQAPAVQKAEAIPAPGPVNNPITEAAAPVIEMLPPEWQQPAEQVMDVVEAFVPQLAPPAPAQASAPVYEEASVPAYQAPQVMAPPAPADLVDAAATAAANAGVSSQVVSDVTNMVNGFLGVR